MKLAQGADKTFPLTPYGAAAAAGIDGGKLVQFESQILAATRKTLISGYGAAVYDPVSTEAEWITYDERHPGSDGVFPITEYASMRFRISRFAPAAPFGPTCPRWICSRPCCGRRLRRTGYAAFQRVI